MKKEKDIFDKIMSLPVFNIFEPIYKKYKEILLYLLFGGLTTVISIASYTVCNITFGINELIANLISWVLAVLFAYVTNKIWVFDSDASTFEELTKEMLSFVAGRVATLVIEEIILLIFVTLMHLNSIVVKVIAQIIVIVLNYVISKLLVFKKNAD